MSAIGPKRTSVVAPHMSAFGGKADMTVLRESAFAVAIGGKAPTTEVRKRSSAAWSRPGAPKHRGAQFVCTRLEKPRALGSRLNGSSHLVIPAAAARRDWCAADPSPLATGRRRKRQQRSGRSTRSRAPGCTGGAIEN
jgi:hypothetical protein